MNLAIIGCGVIGQRHLESIINLDSKTNIFIIDKSSFCLAKCKKIVFKKKSSNNFYFLSSIQETDQNFDFVILATNSDNRFNVIKELYKYKKPKFMIIEKFLFDKLSNYEEAKVLFDSYKTKVWVNQWVSTEFSELLNFFNDTDDFEVLVKGKNWNLCSNAVHFIDWFHHINNRRKIKLYNSNLDSLILESNRKDFYESFGSLEFYDSNNNKLLLKCDYEKDSDRKILISLSSKLIHAECELTENSLKGVVYHPSKKENIDIKIRYLSERTSGFIKTIIEKGTCTLPTYDHSVIHHKLIFQTLKNHFDKSNLKKTDRLPIS